MIKKNIYDIKRKITEIAKKYKKNPKLIQLIAVSKYASVQEIKDAYLEKQNHFGENYIQSAIKKIKKIQEKIIWHYIGIIQSNKIKLIPKYFSWCHTVTSIKHAYKLNQYSKKFNKKLNILIQININNEKKKNGIPIENIYQFSEKIIKFSNLVLRGIMVFPEYLKQNNNNKKTYQYAENIFLNMEKKYNSVDTLSMGTSHDFDISIKYSSNCIRIGQKIFSNTKDK